jgi:hypothetical protein
MNLAAWFVRMRVTCKGHESFDVCHSGFDSKPDDDFSQLKTAPKGYGKVILWIVGTDFYKNDKITE